MRAKHTQSKVVYGYKGDLEKEVKKCEEEKAKLSRELPMYMAIKDKAVKEYQAKIQRINDINGFLELVKQKKNEE